MRAATALRAGMAVVAALSFATARADAASITLEVVSNRADLVSDGDALVEVTLSEGLNIDDVAFDVDGTDVSDAFASRENGRIMGLLTDLAIGENELRAIGGGGGASLTITNHPIEGPIFSGPHLSPWICTTDAAGLGPNTPPSCNAPTKIEYFYQAEGSTAFAAYDPNSPPGPARMITTDTGATVPFIIRQETGSADRGIFRTAVLYDPAQPWEPWAPQAGWNGKLFYPFGASCGTVYSQSSAQNVQNANALSQGFMVATSSLNVLGNNCNTVLSAEAMVMLKEHIVDTYGEIRYTFGSGGSGGSIGQNMVANSYPGLLQGITETANFVDTLTTGAEVFDCHVLLNYMTRNPAALTPAQFTLVSGHGSSVATCAGWEAFFSAVENPRDGCGVSAAEHYNPETNPGGCRGSYQDFERNVWGLRTPDVWTAPEQAIGHGFAKGIYDNVGVQYGLNALRDGAITHEQFVMINEGVGGFDIDFNLTPERSVSDVGTEVTAYQAGRVNDAHHLDQVAIIDSRGTGNVDPLTIHTMHHSFAQKERIRKMHGTAANHVVWRGGSPRSSFDVMDDWLTAVEADTAPGTLAEKIIRDKPADARDMCFAGDQPFTNAATCDVLWPYYGAPRIVAGAPATHDNIKCQLKPLDRDDPAYGPVPFTDLQWERLEAVFGETGVCDWSKPSQGSSLSRAWQTYADGPGTGHPMPPAPVSSAL